MVFCAHNLLLNTPCLQVAEKDVVFLIETAAVTLSLIELYRKWLTTSTATKDLLTLIGFGKFLAADCTTTGPDGISRIYLLLKRI